ncbi:MAG: 50S ribosomal protein L1 [Planctomycetota bacterium]|jgi:large subunit ribosomal protein L1
MALTKRTKANAEIKARYQGPQPIDDAVKAVKSFKAPSFDQSVEVCVHLGIDPRQADQQLRGSISMPNGVGKSARVICFCADDKIDDAKGAGAIEAGGADLVAKIEGGWMEFDVAVASPDMMRVVSKLGRTLGPKGLMPSPKAGTVTPDVVTAVKEYGAGKLEYRNDDGGNIHCIIGKTSFSDSDLAENLQHFLAHIDKIRPAATKGQYLKKCVISGTMTPGIQVAV